MEAVADLYFRSLLAPFAAGFIIEFFINRRPVVVALTVAALFSLALAAWLGVDTLASHLGFFAFNMLFGGVAALIGSGAGRGLRLVLELWREDRASRARE